MQLSDFDASNNLVALFLARADEMGARPFLWAKRDGVWHSLNWDEAARQVCLVAEALRALGLKDGDRVMLVSENRPEWCLSDLAVMAAGCITVPTYTTNTERDHMHILENSGAKAAIVSDAKLARPLLPAVLRSDIARHVISFEPLRQMQAGSARYHDWSGLLDGDAAAARAAVDARIASIKREDMACIIYTSGTGGAPRGVMQHHGMILRNVDGAARMLAEDFDWDPSGEKREVFLSFLPLSHAYEHTGGQYLPIGLGAEIFYSEGLEKLASNIEEVRPTIMVVVPRLFEVLRTRIMKQIEKQGRVATYLLDRALAIGDCRAKGRKRLRDIPMDLIVGRALRPKIRQKFGGRIKAMVSGGAPLNPDVGVFFDALGLTMLQGYGQTESGPVISCNRPKAGLRMDTVGPPLLGVEVRIAEDGEILIRGPIVMPGYWGKPEATAETIVDGWLHTGDIGHLDEKNRIVITDRKKDMIVNDKGDNVSPQKVEGMLTLQPEIAQAMAFGDRRPHLVALIVPAEDWASSWAARHGKPERIGALIEDADFRRAVGQAVERVNHSLSNLEKIRRFSLVAEPFTIDNRMLTPTMKIRRHVIRDAYGKVLAGLYE